MGKWAFLSDSSQRHRDSRSNRLIDEDDESFFLVPKENCETTLSSHNSTNLHLDHALTHCGNLGICLQRTDFRTSDPLLATLLMVSDVSGKLDSSSILI